MQITDGLDLSATLNNVEKRAEAEVPGRTRAQVISNISPAYTKSVMVMVTAVALQAMCFLLASSRPGSKSQVLKRAEVLVQIMWKDRGLTEIRHLTSGPMEKCGATVNHWGQKLVMAKTRATTI